MRDDSLTPRAARLTTEYLASGIQVGYDAATRGQRLPGGPAQSGPGDEWSRPCDPTTAARVSAGRPRGPGTTTDRCAIQQPPSRASAGPAPAAPAAKPRRRQRPGTSRG